jgi:hypothetical protein
LDSGFPEFGCPEVVFIFTKFPLRQQISCLFYFSHLRYFVEHNHILGNLEVIIYFQDRFMNGFGDLWQWCWRGWLDVQQRGWLDDLLQRFVLLLLDDLL